MKKILGFVALLTLGQAAYALPMLSGSIAGPLSSTDINIQFQNDSTAGESIVALILGGTSNGVFWDDAGTLSGQSAHIDGEFSTTLTLSLLSTWGVGDSLLLSGVEANDIDFNAQTVGDLAGVTVTAAFSNQAEVTGEFVVSDVDGGLRLVTGGSNEVPAPATLLLLGLSLAGLGFARRK